MQILKPKKLQKENTIGLLSVSGVIEDIKKIAFAKKYFENKGYNVIVSDTTYKKFRFHSGNDEERINTLQEFFENDNINAIVCTRGGYGLLRILNKINYEIIRNNPKIICGYSDITALLLMIYKKTGMVCFHGAMAKGDFGNKNISNFTEKSFFNTLTKNVNHKFTADGLTINDGCSKGILWGGNLATITTMIGLDFLPDENFIFFTEDINEPAYKIDRMFTQLLNLNQFKKNIKGLAIGDFSNLDKPNYTNDLLKEIANELKIPISTGIKNSHEKDKDTIPIGVKCIFNSTNKIIEIKETLFKN